MERRLSGADRFRVMRGTTLMHRCQQENMDTKEYGKMLQRTRMFEEGRVLAHNARGWTTEGQERRVTRKKVPRLKKVC